MNDIWTIQAALDWTVGYLERKEDTHPRLSAEWLMAEATGLSRIELYVNFDKPLSSDERAVLREYVARRGAGEPLQLISGTVPFRYLTLHVAPGVLIPRPETEVLVSEALRALDLPRVSDHILSGDEGEKVVEACLPDIRVIDLCTGSGCIACSIASEYPKAHVLALDIAPAALNLARRNVSELGLSDRVEIRSSDLLDAVIPSERGSFDLVISNPPYVPTSVMATLDREVSDFEPHLALDGGNDGLDIYRRFLPDAYACLRPGGILAVELFETALESACELAREIGFENAHIVNDLAGHPRVMVTYRPQ